MKRRFSQVRLYTSGKILHITERNIDKSDIKKYIKFILYITLCKIEQYFKNI